MNAPIDLIEIIAIAAIIACAICLFKQWKKSHRASAYSKSIAKPSALPTVPKTLLKPSYSSINISPACPPGMCSSRPDCFNHRCPSHPIQKRAAQRLQKS